MIVEITRNFRDAFLRQQRHKGDTILVGHQLGASWVALRLAKLVPEKRVKAK